MTDAFRSVPRFPGVLLLPSLALLAACASGPGVPGGALAQPDLERARSRFAQHGVTGAFVLLTPGVASDPGSATQAVVVASGDDAGRRTIPASTFKIPNTLIGLETGAVKPDEVFRWDGKPREFEAWERDLAFIEAFRVSCLPCYQELARRVGIEPMRRLVRELGYGNGEVGDTVDIFWIDGPLKISVREEAEFVRRVHLGELPFGRAHLETLKAAMKLDDTPAYRLFAKTGWAGMTNRVDPGVGWFVGWVETPEGPRFFATRVVIPQDGPKTDLTFRKRLTLELLKDVGAIK